MNSKDSWPTESRCVTNLRCCQNLRTGKEHARAKKHPPACWRVFGEIWLWDYNKDELSLGTLLQRIKMNYQKLICFVRFFKQMSAKLFSLTNVMSYLRWYGQLTVWVVWKLSAISEPWPLINVFWNHERIEASSNVPSRWMYEFLRFGSEKKYIYFQDIHRGCKKLQLSLLILMKSKRNFGFRECFCWQPRSSCWLPTFDRREWANSWDRARWCRLSRLMNTEERYQQHWQNFKKKVSGESLSNWIGFPKTPCNKVELELVRTCFF